MEKKRKEKPKMKNQEKIFNKTNTTTKMAETVDILHTCNFIGEIAQSLRLIIIQI